MKRFSFIAVAFIFAAISAVSASAQGPAASQAPAKIVVINTAAFDSKEGITKYANAMTALENEFKPKQQEIQTMMTRYQTLAAEIENARKTNPAVPVAPASLQAKVDEAQGLEIKIKRAQEDGKQAFEKRQSVVLGPILQDIGKAMDDFAKAKGYALILDASKLDGAGLILAVGDAKIDVTKEFIVFYNARPATTATTAAPQR
jgi:Skp family chaperone for outer membrane proteins